MKDNFPLLETLERLFAGPGESLLTVKTFLDGLGDRSYFFIIAALNIPNCIPTGIPMVSSVTGIPMVLLAIQHFLGRPSPSLPEFVGKRGLSRGSLQQMLVRARPHIERLERAVHARNEWWVQGAMRKVTEITWFLVIVVLALPIPFDNLFPAWAIFFFCLALIEDDGIMAMLGWVMTAVTAVWTVFLLIIGPYVVMTVLRSLI